MVHVILYKQTNKRCGKIVLVGSYSVTRYGECLAVLETVASLDPVTSS